MTNDELNMKSMTMDRVKMELEPPRDRYRLIYLTLLLHGLGTLIPWNMFITAKSVSAGRENGGSAAAEGFQIDFTVVKRVLAIKPISELFDF